MIEERLLSRSSKGHLRITGRWIDTESECKQSLQETPPKSVNKVDKECKQSLQKNVNKVDTYNKVEIDKDNEERETRAQKMRVQIFDPVKEETFEINGFDPAEPDIFAERSKSPGSKTADDLFGKMQQYYKVFQNEWAVGIMDFARASKYEKDQRTEILKKWAAHQIKTNSGSDTFGMLHASLQKWFMDQRQFEPKDQQEKTQRITLEFNQ